jgi:hypothetical protein
MVGPKSIAVSTLRPKALSLLGLPFRTAAATARTKTNQLLASNEILITYE